jgi:hypothetical protein
MRFLRDVRGFTGAERALLITFGLAIVLLAGALIRRGSEQGAGDAKRVLEAGWGSTSGMMTPAVPEVPHAVSGAGDINAAAAFGGGGGGGGQGGPPGMFQLAAAGGATAEDFERYQAEHRAVQLYFQQFVLPGAQIEVPIPGSGPGGGTGRADIVLGFEIWEVKPARPWYMDGTGQAQLNRYLENRRGSIPGRMFTNIVVPYPNDPSREIVVNSYGQPGMLYYYVRQTQRLQEPSPFQVPAPIQQPQPNNSWFWWGAGTTGGLVAAWWAFKWFAPLCGPAAPACLVVF